MSPLTVIDLALRAVKTTAINTKAAHERADIWDGLLAEEMRIAHAKGASYTQIAAAAELSKSRVGQIITGTQ